METTTPPKPLIEIDYAPRNWAMQMHETTKRWIVLVLHRRAGKTTAVINHFVKNALLKKNADYAYIAPTYRQAKRIAWKMLKQYTRDIPGMKYNEVDLMATFLTGSTISLYGSESVDALRGIGLDGAALDENSQQPSNIFSEIISKCLADKLGYCIWLGTPKGKNEFYRTFENAKKSEDYFWMFKTIEDSLREEGGETISNLKIALEDDRKLVTLGEMTHEEFDQEWYCFPGYAPVITFNGLKNIKDIKVGEFVLTHANRWRKVLEVLVREYSGKLIKIYSFGNYGEPIVCTLEHPIRICDYQKQIYIWKKAKDVKKGEFVVFPKLNGSKVIQEDLVKIISWFIAEGSTDKNRINFTLNSNETKYIEEICSSLNNLEYSLVKNSNESICNIRVSDTKLVDFLQTNCGSGAVNKRIPFNLIGGHEELVYRILINGDGCRVRNKRENFDSYTTISKTLAYQFQLLAHSLGKTAGITKRKNQNNIIMGRICNVKDSYNVQVRKGGLKLKNTKYSVVGKIGKIEKEDYSGNVYNLTVQYDNSYTAFGREVHNCSFEAAIKGAYYLREISTARKEKRIKIVPYDQNLKVHTITDLGVGQRMAVGFYQAVENERKMIDFWEGTSTEGLLHAIKAIKDKPYVYGKHFAPHDIKSTEISSGRTRLEIAVDLGINFEVIPNINIDDGINAGKLFFSRLWIDEEKCQRWIDAISQYKEQWDDKRGCFIGKPYHDWTSHAADVHRYAALVEDEMTNEDADREELFRIRENRRQRSKQDML